MEPFNILNSDAQPQRNVIWNAPKVSYGCLLDVKFVEGSSAPTEFITVQEAKDWMKVDVSDDDIGGGWTRLQKPASTENVGRDSRVGVVEPAPNSVSLLKSGTVIDVFARRHRFHQRHANFRFSGGDNVRPSPPERSGIAEMSAARQYLQLGIEEPSLPDDFGGVLHVSTQDEAAGSGDASFLQRSRAKYVPIHRGDAISLHLPHRVEIQIEDGN